MANGSLRLGANRHLLIHSRDVFVLDAQALYVSRRASFREENLSLVGQVEFVHLGILFLFHEFDNVRFSPDDCSSKAIEALPDPSDLPLMKVFGKAVEKDVNIKF